MQSAMRRLTHEYTHIWGGNVPLVMDKCYCVQCNMIGRSDMEKIYSIGHDERDAGLQPNISGSLTASDYKRAPVVNQRYIVRRLTPLECERLQGYPIITPL